MVDFENLTGQLNGGKGKLLFQFNGEILPVDVRNWRVQEWIDLC